MTKWSFQLPQPPNSTDKLFDSAEDWWNNACLNYFPSGWAIYSSGYKEAADLLVGYIDEHGRRQDGLVYPIVFLYRQYLELALKDIVRQARQLLDGHQPCPKTHRIDQLWTLCDALLEEVSPGDSVEERREVGRLIHEFAKIDPLSMAFRYPEDKLGNASLPGLTHINVRNLRDVVAKIAVILDGADAQIDYYLSIKSEMGT